MQLQRFKGVWLVLLGSLAFPVVSRSQGTITANPAAVNMLDRQLWRMEGDAIGDFQYGGGIGGRIDVNGDGYGDFFVNFESEAAWKLFYGGPQPDTFPEWTVGNVLADPPYPVIGDFYGDGRKEVAFGARRWSENGGAYFAQLLFYRIDSGRVADSAYMIFDPMKTMGVQFGRHEVASVVDCDGDGVSELVTAYGGDRRNNILDERPEVWFFKGGSGFQVDTPMVIVKDRDELYTYGFYVGLGDIDGDGYVDMVTAGQYKGGRKLKFYWGDAESPWDWTEPGRVVELGEGTPSSIYMALVDLDGDGVKDLAFKGGVIYRSGKKTASERRERSYRTADADVVLLNNEAVWVVSGGYLNDSARKYEMVLLGGGNSGYWFSGGANGIDTTYEAYFHDGWSGGSVFAHVADVGDVDGDGWPDYGASNPYYGNVQGSLNSGVAVIFRGGPSIPGPDRVSGVREVKLEGRSDAVRVWPNPVEDELTIGWRGDLKRMPSRFAVMNALGQRVAYGEVESWRGSAVWQCGDVVAGVYVLVMYDESGELLGSISIVKR